MAINSAKIKIVGCGPGSARYVTEAARQAVRCAEVLVGSKRLLDLFPECGGERILVAGDISAIFERIASFQAAGRKIVVLVSGDPGLYSLAQNMVKHFGRESCEIVPAVSSVQVAFARLGLDWADARILSAHGRTPAISTAEIVAADKIAILAGTREAMRWSAELAAELQSTHAFYLAENLTLENERFQQIEAEQLGNRETASLAIVLLIRRLLLS